MEKKNDGYADRVEVLIEGRWSFAPAKEPEKTNIAGTYIDVVGAIAVVFSDKTILSDTGAFGYEDETLNALNAKGIKPADIDLIFNTHSHFDHISNNHLFPGIPVFRGSHLYTRGRGVKYRTVCGLELARGVSVLATPGHTDDSCSLRVELREKVIVLAGDAVRESVIRGEISMPYAARQTYWESADLIFNEADEIVPGHGRVIKGQLKTELHKLVSDKRAEIKADR